jgi:hypothetical protein
MKNLELVEKNSVALFRRRTFGFAVAGAAGAAISPIQPLKVSLVPNWLLLPEYRGLIWCNCATAQRFCWARPMAGGREVVSMFDWHVS